VRNALLVHGLGRTPLSMFPLAGVVRRAGFRTHFFAHSSTAEPFDGIVRRLIGVLKVVRPAVVVAHSLGGLLTRLALPHTSVALRHLVMLGTPNRPPRLAAYFWKWPPFRSLSGQSGRFLATPAEYDRLPAPHFPCTVIAGTSGPVGRFSPFGSERNDGIVSVGETRLSAADHFTVPAWHTWMMAHPDVHARLAAILSSTPPTGDDS
jgi:pimeloyl-ACP methyl ester carboxylesterase